MDYETKLLLNKLVEFITDPAWWSVIATIFAAIVAACITSKFSKRQTELQEQQLKIQERQNELQEQQIKLQEQQNQLQKVQTELMEQQIKQQEYSLYNRLYKLVKDMDFLITEHMSTSFYYYGALRGTAPVPFTEKKSQVSECIKELDYCWVDFELKFPQEKDVVEKYRFVLTEMRDIYHSLNNRVLFEKEENRDSLKIRKRCRRVNSEDDYELKKGLLSLLPRGADRKYMDECLSRFLEDKVYLEKSNLLDKVAKHCKC